MKLGDRIQFIDAWRCMAVVLVVAHHIVSFSTLHVYFYRVPEAVTRLAVLGRFGVLIFFCISGFVICRGMIQERTPLGLTLTAFYCRRSLRILPPFFIYLSAITFLSHFTEAIQSSGSQIIKAGTFFCNLPIVGDCGWFVSHTWSLAYEEQFYLIFPFLFLLLGMVAKPKNLLIIVGVLCLMALLFNMINANFFANYITMFIYMLSGCAAALYWHKLRPFFDKMPVIIWFALTLLTFVLAGTFPFPPFVEQIKQTLVMPLLICFMVFGTPIKNFWIKAVFENSSITYFGKISFSVYLWQQLATANFQAAPPWLSLILLSAVVFFAYYSYEYLERPFIKLGAHWSNKIKMRASSTLTATPVINRPDFNS